MPKQRFSKLDIRRTALELNAKVGGYWVNNVYDVDDESKMFLLKLTMPGKPKEIVVIESGVRFHTSKFVKDTPSAPSGFSMKLRKHIRTKRLLSVTQFGEDRVVDFKFGLFDKKESEYHIILEMYAAGNVVLTDNEYNVLSLIRVFKDDEVRFAVGENYLKAIGKVQLAEEQVQNEADDDGRSTFHVETDQLKTFLSSTLDDYNKKVADAKLDADKNEATPKGKKSKGIGSVPNLKQALSLRSSIVNVLGPDLIEHCILLAGLNPGTKINEKLIGDVEALANLAKSFCDGTKDFYAQLADLSGKAGYLIYEKNADEQKSDVEQPVFYDRFDPILLKQYSSRKYVQFDTHADAVDEYFARIDTQRMERQALAHRKQVSKKVSGIKADLENRVKELEDEVTFKEKAAEALTINITNAENAILIIRSSVASGMSWEELNDLIKTEQNKGNPLAAMIESTQLETNEVTLRLPDPEDDTKTVLAKVDINLSGFANVARLYSNKKVAVYKTERTIDAVSKVLSEAEKKLARDLEKHEQNRPKVQVARKANWFEKFQWFISSEGFLVLSGRDAQQNELLVKKYLRKSHGDIYVHADLHGASSCIVRSPRPGVVIPPETLRQAGAMTVSMSSAWTAKIITSAWWVNAEQVSKTAPTGEYLTTGSFMIRGKKNFLPPCRLELVFGFIFKLDETQASFDNRAVEWKAQANIEADQYAFSHSKQVNKPKDKDDDKEVLQQGDINTESMNEDKKMALTHPTENPISASQDETISDNDHMDVNAVATEQNKSADASAVKHSEMNGESESERTPKNHNEAPSNVEVEDLSGEMASVASEENRGDQLGTGDCILKKDSPKAKRRNEAHAGRRPKPEPVKKKTGKPPRGKRGKLNKIKKKYADQTEEDRRLALLALGHKLSETDIAAEDETPKDQAQGTPPKSPARQENRKPGGTARLPKKYEVEEPVNDELNLRSFTCNPQPDDVVLYALPMCAPPSAMTNFKYRVKLTPGTQKKGRAGRQALEVCLRNPAATEREKELLRMVLDKELVMTMQGNVKINAAGLNKNTSKAAKAAKNAKRIKKPRK